MFTELELFGYNNINSLKNKKLDALYSGDIDRIFEAYKNEYDGSWYNFINDEDLLDFITPITSDEVAKTLNILINKLYSEASVITSHEEFDIDFFVELERQLQLHGTLLLAFEFVNRERVPIIVPNHEYLTIFDELRRPLYYTTFKEFEFEDSKHILETRRYAHINKIEYRVFEDRIGNVEHFTSHYWDINYLDFDKFSFHLGLSEWFTTPHLVAYELKTDYKFGRIIPLVEAIDETLTFVKLAVRQSIPTAYIPSDLVDDDCPGGDCGSQISPTEIFKDRMVGLKMIPTIDASKQRVDVIEGELQIDNYEKAIKLYKNEIYEILQISEASITGVEDARGFTNENLTISNRNNLIRERLQQFKVIFEDLGIDVTVQFSNMGAQVSPELITALDMSLTNHNMSDEFQLSILAPHFTPEQVEEEIKRREIRRKARVEEQIHVAGHIDGYKPQSSPNDSK